MAATAEALMNSLAGGDSGLDSDPADGEGSSSDRAEPSQQPENAQGSGLQAGSNQQATGQASTALDSKQHAVSSIDNPGAGDPGTKPTAEQLYQQSMAANREVRSENKALKQQLQELTAKIEALAKPAVKAEEPPKEPDFLEDPKGYVDDAKAKLAKLTEQLEADKKQQTEAQQKQQQAQETWNKVIAAEQEFAATTPDYHDALNHVRAIRAEQIKIEIRETEEREPTAEEIGKILSIQEAQGAATLIAKGKNPSKFYYEYAKTFGYKPKAAADPAAVAAAAKPDKDAVRSMGSGGASDSTGDDAPVGDGALGILAAAQNEHKAQFKRRK